MTSAEPSRRHGRYQTHYLIHTHFSRRPYYTNLPFIAADLKRWGYRVDSYPRGSLWIAEQFPKPKRIRPLLLWAREVIKQDRQQRPEEEEEQGVDADVSSVLRDFIRGLVRFDLPSYQYPKTLPDRLYARETHLGYPIPPSTPTVLTFYMGILGPLKVVQNASGPRMALDASDRLVRLTLKFAPHKYRTEHLYKAMEFAVAANLERMGELRDRTPLVDMIEHGDAFVTLWVRAQGEERGDREGGAVEELPVYVSEEEGTEGELPPSYDEVVVRETGRTW